MEEIKVLELVLKKIEARAQDLRNILADGMAKDFAEYRHVCGQINGLSHATLEVQDLLTTLRKNQ